MRWVHRCERFVINRRNHCVSFPRKTRKPYRRSQITPDATAKPIDPNVAQSQSQSTRILGLPDADTERKIRTNHGLKQRLSVRVLGSGYGGWRRGRRRAPRIQSIVVHRTGERVFINEATPETIQVRRSGSVRLNRPRCVEHCEFR